MEPCTHERKKRDPCRSESDLSLAIRVVFTKNFVDDLKKSVKKNFGQIQKIFLVYSANDDKTDGS